MTVECWCYQLAPMLVTVQVREGAAAAGVLLGGENALPCFVPGGVDQYALDRIVYNTKPWSPPLQVIPPFMPPPPHLHCSCASKSMHKCRRSKTAILLCKLVLISACMHDSELQVQTQHHSSSVLQALDCLTLSTLLVACRHSQCAAANASDMPGITIHISRKYLTMVPLNIPMVVPLTQYHNAHLTCCS